MTNKQTIFSKKSLSFILIGLVMLCSLQSCDWVRSSLGMATSADIKNLKAQIVLKQDIEKQLKDSLDKALSTINMLLKSSDSVDAKMDKRFHIIVGCFQESINAEEMCKKLVGLNYKAIIIKLKNGMQMVSVGSFDSILSASSELMEISIEEFCPYDVWIYDINQNLHVK